MDNLPNIKHILDKVKGEAHVGSYMPFDEWVEKHYKFNEITPFSFAGHEYLRPLFNDDAKTIYVQKPAQMGLTEWMIATAFWWLLERKANVFYVFPSFTQLKDMVPTRINPVILYSDYISSLQDKDSTDNIAQKVFGGKSLYLRGATTRKQLISASADVVLKDEVDEWTPQSNLKVVEKRIEASDYKVIRGISTPTHPDFGINKYFKEGDQRYWFIKCEVCNHWQSPDIDKNMFFSKKSGEVKIVCEKCGSGLDRLAKGEYVAKHPGREIHSYQINKLCGGRSNINDVYKDYQTILSGKAEEQVVADFYFQTIGVPYTPKGMKLDNEMLNASRGTHKNNEVELFKGGVMGIDVGNCLHVIIGKRVDGNLLVKALTIVAHENSERRKLIGLLMEHYDISLLVIDAMPETGLVRDIISDFAGRVLMNYYRDTKMPEKYQVNYPKHKVDSDRTGWMDAVREGIFHRDTRLPKDAVMVDELYDHLKSPTRTLVTNEDTGDVKAKYIHTSADHYYHAMVYCRIADSIFSGASIEFDIGQKPEQNLESTPQILELMSRYAEFEQRYLIKNGHEPSEQEVMTTLNISEQQYLSIINAIIESDSGITPDSINDWMYNETY